MDISSRPGIESRPQQWKCRLLNTGLPGNSRRMFFKGCAKGHTRACNLMDWVALPGSGPVPFSRQISEVDLHFLLHKGPWFVVKVSLSAKIIMMATIDQTSHIRLLTPHTACNPSGHLQWGVSSHCYKMRKLKLKKEASSTTEEAKAVLTCRALNIVYRQDDASSPFPPVPLFTFCSMV